MQTFCKGLTKLPVPVSLLAVIQKLIPSKGIRRKFWRFGIIRYIEDDPYLFEDDNNENTVVETSDKSKREDDSDTEAQTETNSQTTFEGASSSKIPLLTNITNDPLINQDAKFLDTLQIVLEENKLSVIFKAHMKKVKAAFYEEREESH